MSIPSKILIGFLLLGFAVLSGCGKEQKKQNLKVPRLMMEARGVNYGGLTGAVATLPVSGTKIQLQRDPLVSEFEIRNVELVKVDLGLALLLQVSEKGARELYRASVSNNGGRVVLEINGNAIGARRFDGAITDGNLYTFVEIPDDELEQLVFDLKASILEIQTSQNK
jgi:hypothetical protein